MSQKVLHQVRSYNSKQGCLKEQLKQYRDGSALQVASPLPCHIYSRSVWTMYLVNRCQGLVLIKVREILI